MIGVNLLREGLDLPQVSLVAILDADKEGFLRNHRSLTQTAGRAARNVNGKVIMYADKITDSMQKTIDETERRRAKQIQYNRDHGITPTPIVKKASAGELLEIYGEEVSDRPAGVNPPVKKARDLKKERVKGMEEKKKVAPRPYIEEEHRVTIAADPVMEYMSQDELRRQAEKVQADMIRAAKNTDFIEAARLRDELLKIRQLISQPQLN